MAEDRSAIHAFVMAGGLGARLRPLTADQCKPALPFGADHRVVDFVLANLRNSGVDRVDLLVQYEPASLVQHVRQAWCGHAAAGHGLRIGIDRFGASAPAADLYDYFGLTAPKITERVLAHLKIREIA